MRKIITGIAALAAVTTMALAGGAIAPIAEIEPIEVEMDQVKSGFYVGGGLAGLAALSDRTASVNGVDYTQNLVDETFTQIAIGAGYNVNDYVAVEGRYYFGLTKTIGYGNLEGYLAAVDASIDSFGIYVKPQYSFGSFNLYGLLGYGSSEYDIALKSGDVTAKSTETIDGFSWGLGAGYAINEDWGVYVDYVSLYDDNNQYPEFGQTVTYEDTLDVVTVGVNYNF